MVAANGTLTGTPVEADLGPDTFTVWVTDGIAPPVQGVLEIHVAPEFNPLVWFADTFDRSNGTSLNASKGGKSRTLGILNWNEKIPPATTPGDVEILSNQMALQSGSSTTLSGVP